MKLTEPIKQILSYYESDSPGTKANLTRILMHGRLGGTGKMVILPVDQGFEHGPVRSFAANPDGYDPHYHFTLAIEAGLNAYAAPLGMLEAGANTYAGMIPLILKINSANSLSRMKEDADQAITASVEDALRLGCSAIGMTIYPGSDQMYEQYEEVCQLAAQAKRYGLVVVIWSYPRGGELSKKGETALDIVGYAAHMAALLGAHIIKVKLPTIDLENRLTRKTYEDHKIPLTTLTERVAHIMQCAFNRRRLVVFSGGPTKNDEELLEEVRAIRDGGGNGSIVGRNSFQRPFAKACTLFDRLIDIYSSNVSGMTTTSS